MHTHKFNTQQERDNYLLSNDYETPFLSTHGNESKPTLTYQKEAENFIYYTQQPLTFKITSPGDIIWQGTGITIEYKKNNEEWSSITSQNVEFYSTQITVSGKSGTYTYGGYDSGRWMYYWENGDDKLYNDGNYLEPGNHSIYDSDWNIYRVLTSQYDIAPTSTQITVNGKSGTYTYGGYDSGKRMYYWENGDDKLYNEGKYLEPGIRIYDSGWSNYEVLTSQYEKIGPFVSVVSDDVVQFKGNNATYNHNNFSSTCNFNVEGNIMSLIDSTGYTTATTLSSAYTFADLFQRCTGLTSAENLILLATTLADSCYLGMFFGCTSLTTAPELPVTTLAIYCYQNMFSGCTSLTTAPELPATTLANYCYNGMFQGCTSLTTASELPATTLATYCYQNMFSGCTSLTTAPELPATTLANYCYSNMFQGCTSLTTAPELPATTLANYCYNGMFRSCTSLTTAPELPATTMNNSCYYYMFYGCTNLNYIKCLATDISAYYCTSNWVNGVSATGTFVKAPSMTGWTTGYNGIPSGWVVEDNH